MCERAERGGGAERGGAERGGAGSRERGGGAGLRRA